MRHFDAAVAKLASGQEADAQLGDVALGKLPASQLAHLPSPHRRRGGVPNAPGASPQEEAGFGTCTEAPPGAGSYRDRLRADGQRALQRAWDCSLAQRPGLPPPPPTSGLPFDAAGAGVAAAPGPPPAPLPNAGGEVAAGQEQYFALCHTAPSLQQALAAPPLPPPAAPGGMSPTWATSPTDGLMAIAMPQASSWMDGEQIAAQLRAAVPTCYED